MSPTSAAGDDSMLSSLAFSEHKKKQITILQQKSSRQRSHSKTGNVYDEQINYTYDEKLN